MVSPSRRRPGMCLLVLIALAARAAALWDCPPDTKVPVCGGGGANPCSSTACGPNEVCQIKQCVCEAECVPNDVATITAVEEQPAADAAAGAPCAQDLCAVTTCIMNSVCRVVHSDGVCAAVCEPLPVDQLTPAPEVTTTPEGPLCPEDKPLANCLVDPCKGAGCGDGEQCQADYCGGCNYACMPAEPEPELPASADCPPDKPAVVCETNPCASMICMANSVCKVNTCGECSATCEQLPVEPEPVEPPGHAQQPAPDAGSDCPPGRVVDCLDPCLTARCPGNTKCVANYCGTCSATCVPDDVTAPAPELACPANRPRVQCLVDPCRWTKCATGKACRADSCGGCFARCEHASEDSGNVGDGGQDEPSAPGPVCPYDPCQRVECVPSSWRTVCISDAEDCSWRCEALPLPACPPGTGFDSRSKRVPPCEPCQRGFVSNNGSNVCAACAADHYAVSGSACEPCAAGFHTAGRRGQAECIPRITEVPAPSPPPGRRL